MPDDHSEVVPLLPIPNRTVKRLCADDSADSRVKVGHRQAIIRKPAQRLLGGFFFELCNTECVGQQHILDKPTLRYNRRYQVCLTA